MKSNPLTNANLVLKALMLIFSAAVIVRSGIYLSGYETPILSESVIDHWNYDGPRFNQCDIRTSQWIVTEASGDPTLELLTLTLLPDWQVVIIADGRINQAEFHAKLQTLHQTTRGDAKMQVPIVIHPSNLNKVSFSISEHVGKDRISQRNLGYLYAIGCGAEVIYEVDGTTMVKNLNYWKPPPNADQKFKYELARGDPNDRTVNQFAYFGRPEIWPPGLPLESLPFHNYEYRRVQVVESTAKTFRASIQQALVDIHPELDDVFRLSHGLISDKDILFSPGPPILAVRRRHIAPIQLSNTFVMRDAFWSLCVPVGMKPRDAGIWRGYWAQRLLWETGSSLIFLPPNAESVHEMAQAQLKENIDFYDGCRKLVQFLLAWERKTDRLDKEMMALANAMAAEKLWDAENAQLIKAWLVDLQSVGYEMPRFHEEPAPTPNSKHIAVCITGQADRSHFGIGLTLETIAKSFAPHDVTYDLFTYISTFRSSKEDIEYSNCLDGKLTYGTMYNDHQLMPFPREKMTREFFDRFANVGGPNPNNLFQQFYGQMRCQEIIDEYSNETKTSYLGTLRLRTDHRFENPEADLFGKMFPTGKIEFAPDSMVFPNEYWNWGGFQDRIFWGDFKSMHCVMTRYSSYQWLEGHQHTLHPETTLRIWTTDYCKIALDHITQPEIPYCEISHYGGPGC